MFDIPTPLGLAGRTASSGWAVMPGHLGHLMLGHLIPGHPGLRASQPGLGVMENIKHIDRVKIWPFSAL